MEERDNEVLNTFFIKIFGELTMMEKELDELKERLEKMQGKIEEEK